MPQELEPNIVRTESVEWISENHRELEFRFKQLSGEHIGARIEELTPGNTSSYHHFHTTEEEHVFMLSGEAILHFGTDQTSLTTGDHVWFRAGEEVAHHLENRSENSCTYLVYGERKTDDVVMYPDAQVMLVKALGRKQFIYRAQKQDTGDAP